ncbi:MAG: cyclase family protein [Anaerolineales bacterium]
MRTYDITLPLSNLLPTWPGDPRPVIERFARMEDGSPANVSQISMSAHTGTHVDAPYHFVKDGETVERMSLKMLIGRAYVLDVSYVDQITAETLNNAEIPPRTRRLLFKTRNSNHWAYGHRDFDENYVSIMPDAAQLLVERGVRLVGVDYLSVAPFNDPAPTHQILLGAGVIIVEGLDLSGVSEGRYTLYCLPLKLLGADGAPARAVLVGV